MILTIARMILPGGARGKAAAGPLASDRATLTREELSRIFAQDLAEAPRGAR